MTLITKSEAVDRFNIYASCWHFLLLLFRFTMWTIEYHNHMLLCYYFLAFEVFCLITCNLYNADLHLIYFVCAVMFQMKKQEVFWLPKMARLNNKLLPNWTGVHIRKRRITRADPAVFSLPQEDVRFPVYCSCMYAHVNSSVGECNNPKLWVLFCFVLFLTDIFRSYAIVV